MLRAVLFDFGGVFTCSPLGSIARFEQQHDLPKGLITHVNSQNHLDNAWARLERNVIDQDQFDAEFRAETRAAGNEISGSALLSVLAGPVRPAMVTALQRIKTKFKTGCITNNMVPALPRPPELAAQVARIMSQFDEVLESSKIGIRKPDPRIYLMMCERLGLQPHDCIYLDDLGINLKPARALGMQTYKVRQVKETINALEQATGLHLH